MTLVVAGLTDSGADGRWAEALLAGDSLAAPAAASRNMNRHERHAVVTHGGITVDLLRNLLGDQSVPPHALTAGIPPCAITAVDGPNVVMIASVAHLS